MKRMKIKRCHVVSYIGLLVCLLLATSCQPVVEEIPSDKYDTLLLSSKSVWTASVMHTDQDSGYLKAHIAVLLEQLVEYDFREYENIPYIGYNFDVEAYTQDSLLPLGKYTTHIDDTCHILLKDAIALGAGTKSWYKSRNKLFAIEDATMYIGQDAQQEYYLDLFVQMEEGEKLYLRCTRWERMYEHSLTTFYYPK